LGKKYLPSKPRLSATITLNGDSVGGGGGGGGMMTHERRMRRLPMSHANDRLRRELLELESGSMSSIELFLT
jgi:hypothetical protein